MNSKNRFIPILVSDVFLPTLILMGFRGETFPGRDCLSFDQGQDGVLYFPGYVRDGSRSVDAEDVQTRD